MKLEKRKEILTKFNKQEHISFLKTNYPNNPDYQPALKSLLNKKAPTEAALEAITDKNATDTTQKINALTDLPVEKLTFQAIDNLTATFPHDASVKTKAKQLKQSLINYQNSLNEPGYKAKLHGFKLLDEQKYDLDGIFNETLNSQIYNNKTRLVPKESLNDLIEITKKLLI